MWRPWVWLRHIRKFRPRPSKLGSNANLRPAAVGSHWTPIFRDLVRIFWCVLAGLTAFPQCIPQFEQVYSKCLREHSENPWFWLTYGKLHRRWGNAVSLARTHQKMRTKSLKIGVQCEPTAAAQRFALDPNFEGRGLHFLMCPSQTHGLHIDIR